MASARPSTESVHTGSVFSCNALHRITSLPANVYFNFIFLIIFMILWILLDRLNWVQNIARARRRDQNGVFAHINKSQIIKNLEQGVCDTLTVHPSGALLDRQLHLSLIARSIEGRAQCAHRASTELT